MILASAPGKLFIAGEYAVVEPGEPAILIAVDRFLTVHASASHGGKGTITSAHYAEPLSYEIGCDGVRWNGSSRADLVTLTVEHMLLVAREHGLNPQAQNLSITSALDSPDGTKYGLGSSGAVTVALIDVLNRTWGIGLTSTERFRIGLLITIQLSPNASGADLATQTLGGWVRYSSPDRVALRGTLATKGFMQALQTGWDGCALEALPTPTGIICHIGWTGRPAHTDTLVTARDRTSAAYSSFLPESNRAVDALSIALQGNDTAGILEAYARSRDALLTFDRDTGGGIETVALHTLRMHAERDGAVAKPSGAGGGDCGVVLSDSHLDLSRMLKEWKHAGIEHLPLTVTTQEDKR